MIVIIDINTIWRRKPFEALAEQTPILGLMPRDIFTRLRNPQKDIRLEVAKPFYNYPVAMPPGWASKFPGWTARRLWSVATKAAKREGAGVSALVVTSPHYLSLVKHAGTEVPTFYYCSDDYGEYEGWGGNAMLKQEGALVRTVNHSFFVSSSLSKRAIQNYNVPSDCISVSPNATDESFLKPVSESEIEGLFTLFPQLRRPLVGVVGGINNRLDAELLLAVAERLEIGTLVMVGPVASDLQGPAWTRLRSHPTCLFVGAQRHVQLPAWMQALDVALIPYRDTPLNRSCSPMRLFDHLAAGKPIVSTDHCRQVREFDSLVEIAPSTHVFLEKLSRFITKGDRQDAANARREAAAKNLWSFRAEQIAKCMESYRS